MRGEKAETEADRLKNETRTETDIQTRQRESGKAVGRLRQIDR